MAEESCLSFYLVSTSSSLSPFKVNLLRMVLRASLGSFLAFTVLMRSGISYPLRDFMVEMNLLCCMSL